MRLSPYLGLAAMLALSAQIAAAPRAVPAQQSAIARLPNIRLLSMVTPTAGWALEATTVLSTTTAGNVWVNVTPSGVAITQTSQAFALNARTVWVTATRPASQASIIVRTIDGGHTWQRYPLSLPSDAAGIEGITFVDAQHGWLLVSLGAGAGSEGVQILRTVDGGRHWATVSRTASSQPAPGSLPLSGIKTGIGFRDATTGWVTAAVAGPNNFSWLYMTRDGGHTWQHQSLTFPAPYQQVIPVIYPPRFFTPKDGNLPVVLNMNNQALDFYSTHDGGLTWASTTPLPFRTTTVSPSWSFSDPNHGWAAWGVKLHITADGGRHWSAIVPNVSFQSVTQLDFVSVRAGWALGSATANRSLLLRTVDGGRTWSRLSPYVIYPPGSGVHPNAGR